ncbi:MAG: S41 family peptidase [Leptospiraceae bacterium]|nr:S41 family peptidase [Leptospiraceae bacterium]
MTILSLLLVSTLNCEPKQKKKKPTNFTARDFENVIAKVHKDYIDKNIDEKRAYTDAAVYAMKSLPHSLFLYPESYFNERDQYEEKDDIWPGKTFKIEASDSFIIFDPDYKKVEEMIKAKTKKDTNKKLSDEEIKQLTEREQTKKNIIAARWEEANFTKKDFDRIMSYLQENLSKYKKPPIKNLYGEEAEEEEPEEEFQMKDVWVSATNGYLNSLDPHSSIFLKEIWEESMAKITDSSFEGIGAILSGGGNRDVIVENPLEDRPAVKAGLRSGDVIVAVDGKGTKGLLLDKVVKRIKGKRGTTVTLLIKRKGVAAPFEIKIVRDRIEIKNVTSRLLKDNEHIGYIKLSGFVKSPTESSDDAIKEHFKDLQKKAKKKGIKLKALVLDLRNNAGGYLDLAVDISDMFIKEGVIVSTKSPHKGTEESYARKPDLTDLPMAVLINAKSASASEIVASAIKDHGRGILLGERTFGKATVQKLMDIPGNPDYILKLTQSRYYAPSGRTIQVVGVEPDIKISAEEDGSFPFQYREENMWNHLPKIPSEAKPKDNFNMKKLEKWVEKNGKAVETLEKQKNGPIKPDYQLVRSIDYINALINHK